MNRTPKTGEFYRHFKNKLYQIVGVATHSETKEKLVIYKALYGTYEIYARPLDMFVSEVDHVKYPEVTQKYRFEHVTILENGEVVSAENDNVSTDDNSSTDNVSTHNHMGEERCVTCENETETDKRQQSSIVHEKINLENDAASEGGVNPKLMEFLDADTYEEKYNVLVSMRDDITDRLIDDMAVVLDIVVPEGELMKRYDDLKSTLRTRQHYEFSNRLR